MVLGWAGERRELAGHLWGLRKLGQPLLRTFGMGKIQKRWVLRWGNPSESMKKNGKTQGNFFGGDWLKGKFTGNPYISWGKSLFSCKFSLRPTRRVQDNFSGGDLVTEWASALRERKGEPKGNKEGKTCALYITIRRFSLDFQIFRFSLVTQPAIGVPPWKPMRTGCPTSVWQAARSAVHITYLLKNHAEWRMRE